MNQHHIVMNPNAQTWLTRNWKAAQKDDSEYQWDYLENALNILEVCAPTNEERRESPHDEAGYGGDSWLTPFSG